MQRITGWLNGFAAALCLTASAMAGAAEWEPNPASARFQRLTTDQGLSQSSVMAFAQDSQGRMWIGTQAGLNRFNGYEVTVFRPDSSNIETLSDNYVNAMAVDPQGHIWVATLDGLNRIDPISGRFTIYRNQPGQRRSLAASRISALHVDARGNLWIGGEKGVSRWHPDTDDFDNWSNQLGNAAGLPDDRISALTSDNQGRLWVGTTAGLARFDVDQQRFTAISPPALTGAEITALMVDRAQRLWVATDGHGLAVGEVDLGRWQVAREQAGSNASLSSDSLRGLLQDRSGRIWIGTDLGVDMLAAGAGPGDRFAHFRHHRQNPDGIGGGRVAALFEDAEGSIWVGTWNNGASWLSPSRNQFASFTPDQQVTAGFRNPSSIALTTFEDQLWIGSGEGLYRFDTTEHALIRANDSVGNTTFFGAQTVDAALWFGTSRGVRVVDPITAAAYSPPLPDALAGGRVRRVWVDPQRVWLATDPLGMAVLDRSLEALETLHPINRSITFIKPLGDGLRLAGAYDGLYWFDASNGKLLYVHPLLNDAKSQDGIGAAPMDFARTADGRLWLATNGAGLREILLDDLRNPASARFQVFDANQGLADPALKAMLVDASDVLWLSTASGISAFDPTTRRFSNFGRADGTLGHDYINGSATRFADGSMAFGAMDGFTLFDPRLIALDAPAAPPAVLLTALDLDGKPAAQGVVERVAAGTSSETTLRVPAGSARSISFRFAAPDFVRADVLRYQYRLEGFDPAWVDVESSRRVAAYTNLEPAIYSFAVRVANGGSSWSAPTRLAFEIEPFWWQRYWARGGAVLLFAALLALGYHLRLRQAARMQALLTRQVAERTAALEKAKTQAEGALRQLESTQQELVRAEKMAALGQLVAGVAHEVNTPLGVALTASSCVGDEAMKITKSVAAGSLKRSDLTTFIERVNQSNTMIQRNLDRAADLIQNFKQVSVDRSSDGRRQFALRVYLGELLQSLQLMWRRSAIENVVECPEDIVIDSFPGALGQIITNLMQNSVRHGFPDEASGHMTLVVRRLDEQRIEIRQSDDGVGIPPENIARIFDPFFTTQRNKGGTGLGLHIVFNLVTQKLGGTIEAQSEVGKGTTFVLTLPISAPV